MRSQNNLLDTIGGYWVACKLLVRCKFRTGEGSYLAWRKETAFGKYDAFPRLSRMARLCAVLDWAVWARRQQRVTAKYHSNA